MNFNNFTIKSQEAVQKATEIAAAKENQAIEVNAADGSSRFVSRPIIPLKPARNARILGAAGSATFAGGARVESGARVEAGQQAGAQLFEFVIVQIVLIAKTMAKQEGVDKSGYRVLINVEKGGGQVIFHLHLHLIGGWKR